jgi:hypothetical protein
MRLPIILGAAVLTLAGVSSALAQTDRPDEVHLRNDCRLAAQVLNTGQPANKREWAIGTISLCAQEGPPILARMWSQVTSDSAQADSILDLSSRLRDARIAEAATAVAKDAGKTDAVRLAAIVLLIRYADPYSGLSVRLLAVPQGWTPGRPVRSLSGGRSPHAIYQTGGGSALPPTFTNDVIRLLRSLASSDPSVRVRYAAEALARRLEWDLAHGYVQ